MGKKRFGRDWGRKVWLLLVKLVWMVMPYGVEICGWKEKEGIEKLWERAGKRTWEFEKRLDEG